MHKLSDELKTGFLIALAGFFLVFFAWIMGVQSPFRSYFSFYVVYNFAGGIEVGSPVRLSGIKVGKVESIEFFSKVPSFTKTPQEKTLNIPQNKNQEKNQEEHPIIVPLKLKISLSKKAHMGIRKDSQFFINLAGLIGERYIEITPGNMKYPAIEEGEVLLGKDPPRIDQMISQSFDLAGKIMEVIEHNKADVSKTIELLFKLSTQLNQTLTWIDKSKLFKSDLSLLLENINALTTNLKEITASTQSEEAKIFTALIKELLLRLKPLDAEKIQTFFQKQGIKVQIF